MKILVTGTAGFVGFHLAEQLLRRGDEVVGIDNINDYYDPKLKFARLAESGIDQCLVDWHTEVQSSKHIGYRFIRMNLEDKAALMTLCAKEHFDVIVHLAAQAGVRYSITNPDAYAQSNLISFLNILEASRHNPLKHLVYASSSSVYGLNGTMPFSVKHCVDHPISLYAASKKANELMAHTYSHLYKIPTSGLRFFTVYGPWGRPDMAYFSFADAICHNKPIPVFNYGKMRRDFTYIDDIVKGVVNVIDSPAAACQGWDNTQPDPSRSSAPYCIYNIGNNQPVELLTFIRELEKCLGKEAILELKQMQPGDVTATWANIDDLIEKFNYRPDTTIEEGLRKFTDWYKAYYAIEKLQEISIEAA
ncbi:NAD-dependent epimerase [Pontibacter akesuensis]|uniref:UDP-glucuronate 4-epimerase n=1 Tax=Pontibacter akesuensis TaxID=388950 RepID=A0A1I7J221_9BACT|nr:NAD-dependent epimerase [Pontibacter akesuensis]GHA72906.1 NAD-dependent epimerase [Pontibacter akesuensis]SFU79174.1 UDP-glucuronate 4-epimerase [Pontibacter akesuensis]